MKVGDLVKLAWYDEIYKEKNLENFVGLITGFDSTGCAYVYSNTNFWDKTVAIPMDRLEVIN